MCFKVWQHQCVAAFAISPGGLIYGVRQLSGIDIQARLWGDSVFPQLTWSFFSADMLRGSVLNRKLFLDFSRWLAAFGTYSMCLSGLQRSGDARGDCLSVCPSTKFYFEQWRIVFIVTEHELFVTSQRDVIFTFVNQGFGEICWHNMNIILHRVTGTAVVQGGSKRVESDANFTKKCYQLCLFCSAAMLTSKIISEIKENDSEVSGCTNSCNKFVLIRFW